MQHHKYSLTELENMMPWEREIYMGLLAQWVKEENEKIEQENAKMKKQRGTRMAVEVTVEGLQSFLGQAFLMIVYITIIKLILH